MSYLGRSAKLSLKAQEKVSFLATAGQTVKTGLSYTPSFVEVYVNGVLLTDTTDFTATNGNSITFTVALLLNDEVTVISLKTFSVADHYSKTEADTLLAAKSPLASPSFTGNVGIGVTPEAWLSTYKALQIGAGGCVTGSNDNSFVSLNGNAYLDSANSRYEYINSAYASQYQQYDGTHNFLVAPSGSADAAISWTTAMTIQNSGEIEFGSSSDVNQQALRGLSYNKQVMLSSRSGTDGHISMFYKGGAFVGSIQVNGSSTIYATSSDYRLKENVTPMSGATARLKLLKPCNFDWISTGQNVDGFLAHEAQEVVPEAASGTKDAMMDEEYEVTPAVLDDEGNETTAAVMGTRSVPDMQGIDQSKLVPLLTATIQELIARIEALEGE